MSSSRYLLIDKETLTEGSVLLSGTESRHLTRVLRAKKGDRVNLLDGEGTIHAGLFSEIISDKARLDILSSRKVPRPPAVDIAIGIFKPSRMDIAVEKCTELGVRKIIPFSCERTIWKDDGENRRKKYERLTRKVESACKQCGQPWFPEVLEPVDVAGLVDMAGDYSKMFIAEKEASGKIDLPEKGAGPVLGIIGPEGGLTGSESSVLKKAGAGSVSLGQLRLRSETAAICLVYSLISACQTPD